MKDKPANTEPGPVLSPLEILGRARSEALRLGRLPRWSVALSGASHDAPLLVRRLDHVDHYYYIVPFRMGGDITARVRINAHTGKYAEAIAIDKRGDVLDAYITAEGIRALLERKRPASVRNRQLAPVVIEPFLAWKPCRQSFSSFLPFYVVWRREIPSYHRVDGQVFNDLTSGAGL